MTAAIALAVVLVIAVAGASMALESQRSTASAPRRAAPRPRPAPPGPAPRRPRVRDRMGRSNPAPPPADLPSDPVPSPGGSEVKGPELLRTGTPAEAKVISVIDERTIGPVTRSRLTLQVQPKDGSAFEVTLRVAFQTPEARAGVKVGGTVPVRYDSDDHSRVVVDLPQD